MKKISLLFIVILIATLAFAQSKKPTNKKEIADKMKQAQQQLDKLTPEQRKMMEQMSISTKVPSIPAGVSDASVKVALGGGAFDVPSKNSALIGAIPQITLSAATVPTYLKTLNDYIEKGITNDAKLMGQNTYTYFKANKYAVETIGNDAIGFWTIGRPEIAIYIMGHACADNVNDADLLSNFAAMLSMGGAPHRAIPLLAYLSKQYPDNTTISNNLGQAWFYLGEINKADTYLEKTVKAFAYHPQANYTQCLIQQSKGNTPKAIEKMKNSLQYSFSINKINMLRKLGYKIKGSDMRKPFRPDPNPLGLHNFIRPEVPVSYESEIKLKVDWDAFQKQLDEKNAELSKAMQPYVNAGAQQAEQAYKQYQTGGYTALNGQSSTLTDNIYSQMADINLNEINKDGGAGYRLKTAKAKIDALLKDYGLKKEAQKNILIKQNTIREDHDSELAKKGENIGYDVCIVEQKFSEWVYSNYNKPLEEAYQNYLSELHLKITEELYWKQFKYTDVAFEAIKINAKKEWLSALRNTRYIETFGNKTNCIPQQHKNSSYKLADFDDMHCAFKSTLDFVGVYKQTFECGKSRIEFDAGKLSGNLNFKDDNAGNNHFSSGTVEITVIDKSISAGKGPLQAGAAVKAGMGIDFTNHGIEDVYATGQVSVNAGAADITASGRMSLISGNMTGVISGFGK